MVEHRIPRKIQQVVNQYRKYRILTGLKTMVDFLNRSAIR